MSIKQKVENLRLKKYNKILSFILQYALSKYAIFKLGLVIVCKNLVIKVWKTLRNSVRAENSRAQCFTKVWTSRGLKRGKGIFNSNSFNLFCQIFKPLFNFQPIFLVSSNLPLVYTYLYYTLFDKSTHNNYKQSVPWLIILDWLIMRENLDDRQV